MFPANANKYSMGRPKLDQTEEGRKLRKHLRDSKTQSVRHRKWRLAHPDRTRLKSANERVSRLQRIPLWANKDEIKQFYLSCPDGMHVDHIIPLRGKTVSGLHVPSNLQYLSAFENISKGNKFEDQWARISVSAERLFLQPKQ